MFETIGLVADILIICSIIIFGFIGLKKGFLKSILSLFSWVVCLVLALLLAKYLAKFINNIYNFSNLIGNKISTSLTDDFYLSSINTFANKEELISSIPQGTNKLFAQLIKVVFSNTSIDYEVETATVGNVLGFQIGNICMIIISALLLFIILKIIVAILNKIIDKLVKCHLIKTVDRILGFVFGSLKAVTVILILNLVLVCLSLIPIVNKTTTPLIQENTYVEKFIYTKTDEIVGKFVIDGQIVQNYISDLWNSR